MKSGTHAGDIGIPQASRVVRIRRDRYDLDGTLASREIVHAVTRPGCRPRERRQPCEDCPGQPGRRAGRRRPSPGLFPSRNHAGLPA